MINPLQINDVRFFKATSASSHRIVDATHDISEITFIITEIELENGILGQGYLLSFHYFPNAIAGALKDIGEFVKQYKVFETGRLAMDFNNESEYLGQKGLLKWVLSSVNIAMWDAWGKVNKQPIWKLLGTSCQRIPVYGSGGWLSYSDQELVDEVMEYKARGYKAVKIKVGSTQEGKDFHRLKLVREAVGNEIKIMMDANQGMTVPSALKLCREAALLNIYWFEEPLHNTDFAGYETLRSMTSISLAMGEREFDTEALKTLIFRNAIDIWQPDILRIGGVDSWLESASLAHAYHLPVLPHFYKDYDVPLLCTIPNGDGVESFDWIDGLIDNTLKIDDGMALPRQAPGWGFKFLYSKLKQISS